MDFLSELKKVAIDELGVDASPVFNFKGLDPAYLKSILEKPFNKSYDILTSMHQQSGPNFKQDLYNLISTKASSGYTKKSARTLLKVALLSKMINLEEYTNMLSNIFHEIPDETFAKQINEQQNTMTKKQLENSDPFAPLYN